MKSFIVLCMVLSLIPSKASAQMKPPSITVRGEATISAKPDYSRITVAVVTGGGSASEATSTHQVRTTRATAEIRKLKDMGIDTERSWFRLGQDRSSSPLNDGLPQPGSRAQFTATTTYELKSTKVDLVNTVVTQLAATGLFEVYSLAFETENPRAVGDRAREAAFLHARMQAEVYALAANVRLGQVIEIVDQEGRQGPVPMAEIQRGNSVEIIPPAQVSINAAVTVTWQIVPRE